MALKHSNPDRSAEYITTIRHALSLRPGQTLFIMSPHLDDALWSLGGVLQILTQAGHSVCVVTVFSETTDTPVRKAEDTEALAAAGCSIEHLDFADAILDGRPVQAVFNESFVPDARVVAMIARRVEAIVPPQATVLAPSGFGAHVDHLTTRAVGMALQNRRVVFYEDMPYAARTVRLANARDFLAARGLQRYTIVVSPPVIARHIELYNLYASQRQNHHVAQIGDSLRQNGFGVWAAAVPANYQKL